MEQWFFQTIPIQVRTTFWQKKTLSLSESSVSFIWMKIRITLHQNPIERQLTHSKLNWCGRTARTVIRFCNSYCSSKAKALSLQKPWLWGNVWCAVAKFLFLCAHQKAYGLANYTRLYDCGNMWQQKAALKWFRCFQIIHPTPTSRQSLRCSSHGAWAV